MKEVELRIMENQGKTNYQPQVCQLNPCKKKRKYGINMILPDGNKQWLWLCDEHEKLIHKYNKERGYEKESN